MHCDFPTSAHAQCGVQERGAESLMAQPQTEVDKEAPQSVAPRSLTFPTNIVGDYERTFVDKIAAKYHCNICSKVLRDAHLTVCCGQHYCDSCLEQWSDSEAQKEKKTCPHCRKEGFESVLNKAMIREINKFRVKCSNHKKGCGWVGELGDLEKHIESENGCGYVMVGCNYYGHDICSHRCQRRSLAEHQRRCTLRRYKCEHCGEVDTYDAIAGGGTIVAESDVSFGLKSLLRMWPVSIEMSQQVWTKDHQTL